MSSPLVLPVSLDTLPTPPWVEEACSVFADLLGVAHRLAITHKPTMDETTQRGVWPAINAVWFWGGNSETHPRIDPTQSAHYKLAAGQLQRRMDAHAASFGHRGQRLPALGALHGGRSVRADAPRLLRGAERGHL